MTMQIVRSVAVLASVGAFAIACGGGKEGGGAKQTGSTAAAVQAGKDPKKFTIAVIAKSSNNPVFLAARTGAEAAAKEISEKNSINVQVLWLTPPQEDGQVQAQRI